MRYALTNIHQIEMTSKCNLRCRYCPQHTGMTRTKEHMSEDIFKLAIEWVGHFRDRGTQHSLNLAGIGESTIHPRFEEFVEHARALLPYPFELVLATNGVNMTKERARFLADARVTTFVSLHRPEKAGLAVRMLRDVGALAGVSADPSVAATDWAGQVKWEGNMAPRGMPCPWVKGGWAIVLADGGVSRCSFDATGVGVFAHVTHDLTKFETSAYKLCRTCHQDVGVPYPNEQEDAA